MKDGGSKHSYASLEMKENGDCFFLDSNRLCNIQNRFGGESLSEICKNYPRKLTENFGQSELCIQLSCPEACRLFLLEENSTDLLEIPGKILEGYTQRHEHLPNSKSLKPYFKYRNEIRQVFLLLAEANQYPTAGRIYLMLHFAKMTQPFFNRNSKHCPEEMLAVEVDSIASPQNHSQLVKQFTEVEPDYTSSAAATIAILAIRYSTESEYQRYLHTIFSDYDIDLLNEKKTFNKPALAALIDHYIEQRWTIEQVYSDRMEHHIERMLVYSCFNYHYIHAKDLLQHIHSIMGLILMEKILFSFTRKQGK
nr:flagellin lysine-N-methylase [Solemya velesiana gill symbiont]